MRFTKQKAQYRIEDHAQLEALSLPARSDIVYLVAAQGPLTVAEMAKSLDKQRPAVHYQVNILNEIGLLQEVGTRGSGRKEQTLYRTPGRAMLVVFDKHDPMVIELTIAHVKNLFQRAIRALSAGFRSPKVKASGAGRNAHILTSLCRLDAKRLAEVNTHIDALRDLCAADTLDSKGELMLVTVALSPSRTNDS